MNLLVWELPDPDDEYDAERIPLRGWSTETAHRWILSKRSNGEQAHWFGHHLDAESFRSFIAQVCRMYNNAFGGRSVTITDMPLS